MQADARSGRTGHAGCRGNPSACVQAWPPPRSISQANATPSWGEGMLGSDPKTLQLWGANPQTLRVRLRPDGNLEHAITSLTENLVALAQVIQRERVRQKRSRIEPARLDERQQPSHALLAARTERRHDVMVAEARGEGIVGH